jgi:hypothetical protein
VTTFERSRDYPATHLGTRRNRGLGAPVRLAGEVPPSGNSPCETFEALFRVSLSLHPSARAFRPGRYSNLRAHSSVIAEPTENLTLSRAHARYDSPCSFGFALRYPLGLERLGVACLTGCSPVSAYRMQYAMRGPFLGHSLTNWFLIRCATFSLRVWRRMKNGDPRVVKLFLHSRYMCALINSYSRNYTAVNKYLQ